MRLYNLCFVNVKCFTLFRWTCIQLQHKFSYCIHRHISLLLPRARVTLDEDLDW
jgi:hypothetical protein